MSKSINVDRACESLSIYFNEGSNTLHLNYSTELDARKSQLYVSEETIVDGMETMIAVLRGTSKFLQCTIGHEEIDHYDNECGYYDVPCGVYTKGAGKRKATIRSTDHYSIPKDWSREFSATFAHGNGIKPIQLFMDAMGIRDEASRKAFEKGARKVIQKKETRFSISPEDMDSDKETFDPKPSFRRW
jgi:hypothetical protein